MYIKRMHVKVMEVIAPSGPSMDELRKRKLKREEREREKT